MRRGPFAVLLLCAAAAAADWPTWRGDARRSAVTDERLPAALSVRWSRRLAPPKSCWPWTQYRLQFDASYEPIVADGLVLVASMVRDRVTAYDADTGEEKWRCYVDGPVRFPPTVWKGRAYFVCDDGYLYCVDLATGARRWRVRGGPSDRKLLGNERLICLWPARGAPVVSDGRVYFAAGVWPFMGVFVCAVDADTGRLVWRNSGSGAVYVLQPHHSPAFAGVAPQGSLALDGDTLLVPGGRSVPAAYDRRDGRFLYYQPNISKAGGGYAVAARGGWFFNADIAYRLDNGSALFPVPASVVTSRAVIGADTKGRIVAHKLGATRKEKKTKVNRKTGKKSIVTVRRPIRLWEVRCDAPVERVLLKAGPRLYCRVRGRVLAAVDAPYPPPGKPVKAKLPFAWRVKLDAAPWSAAAANGKLFVTDEKGTLYCFAAEKGARRRFALHAAPAAKPDEWTRRAAELLKRAGVQEGWALVLGVRSGRLIEELARRSKLHLVGLVADAAKLPALRRRLDDAGLYGASVALLPGDARSVELPPYFASLAAAETPVSAEDAERVFPALRPYGGAALLRLSSGQRAAIEKSLRGRAKVESAGPWTRIAREGPLPGAADWTHQYGDAANTVCSRDQLVRGPLGVLWFGGPSHLDVLPRHGHGPSEQVVDGRLFIEGIVGLVKKPHYPVVMSARDVYTGRVLWRREFPDIDTSNMYYNSTYNPDPNDRTYNQRHIPGANQYGSNFVATKDALYLAHGTDCLALDPATGRTLRTIPLPKIDGVRPNWGYIAAYKDWLIAAAAPLAVDKKQARFNYRYGRGSKFLVVLDRRTGKPLWTRRAVFNFRHNSIVAGRGTLFCLDSMSRQRLAALRRRGLVSPPKSAKPKILALDLRTGKLKWSVDRGVFGTWLGYSEEFDILLEAGSRSGDRAPDEARQGMAAFRGRTGKLLWSNDAAYLGPCILRHDMIITQCHYGTASARPGAAYSLLTGKPIMRKHPLTGQPVPWEWIRFYGCNTAVGSEHVMTFRSAAASYLDFDAGQGAINLGGFKSGCTSNLIPADGVLNAPDYTRTCLCAYQNQCSLALVHMPGVEQWSFDYYPPPDQPTPVVRAGLNFAAPGNHFADGVLWLEYPSVGGPSPDFPVLEQPKPFARVRVHSCFVQGPHAWAAASALKGAGVIRIRPFLQPAGKKDKRKRMAIAYERNAYAPLRWDPAKIQGAFAKPRAYTVRLYFAELEGKRPGERVFDVRVQGRSALRRFDIARAAGGPNREVVKELRGVKVRDDLVIELKPASGSSAPPLLSAVELAAE